MRFTIKRSFWFLVFPALCALLTRCPSNDYTVELQPAAGGTIERTLTFYRADGNNSHGVPDYQTFPSDELAAITGVYPAGAVKAEGRKYIARGVFSGHLPPDVGGVGSYTNFVTSLGNAGIYVERFRGNDDLAGEITNRFHAADKITDLVIGWTRTEFSQEPGYEKLRKFLDEDMRQDLKNAALYAWMSGTDGLSETNTGEFTFRFSQYLYEHGYFTLSDARDVPLLLEDEEDDSKVLRLMQRLMMKKLGMDPSEPPPKSFAVLDSSDALQKSWEKYLAGTDLYHDQLKEWENEKKSNPTLAKPKAADAADDLAMDLLSGGHDLSASADHLTVKLKLDHPPNYTNGKWQHSQVVWSADLDEGRPLPVFCYAGWSNPNVQFQEVHFGSVILDSEGLSQYCFWQGTLSEKQAREWESFLENLKPGPELTNNLAAFHFSAAAMVTGQTNYALIGRKLLMDSLAN